MEQSRRAQARAAVAESTLLALACALSYWLATTVRTQAYSASRADGILSGLWALIATIVVLRGSYGESVKAALSRMAATLVSFVACLVYLLVLPFHLWGLALMIGVTALIPALIGRPGDSITAAITTAVVMVSASLSPHDAWRLPILRFGDTLIGVVVGVAAAWLGLRVVRQIQRHAEGGTQAGPGAG
jgi:uncharacterized membrane protein YccC